MTHPFIPAPNVAKLQAIFDYNGAKVQNVYHFQRSEPYDVDTMTDLAGVFSSYWNAGFAEYLDTTNSLSSIEVTALDEESSPGIVYTTGLPINGDNSVDENLPGNVTVAVRWNTALRGRSYRGRTYHVGLSKANVTDNRVVGLVAIALQEKYGGMTLGQGTWVGHTMVVVSYMSHKTWRTTAVCTPIIACYVDQYTDSQRRRLQGRGT